MAYRGRGGSRGGFRGRGGRGGGRGGFSGYPQGPPDYVIEVGEVMHECEGDLVCTATIEKVPYFNAPIFLENKSQIGKVDEIFGPMTEYLFSVKLSEGMQAKSFGVKHKLYIDPNRLLPLMRFLPRPPGQKGPGGRGGFGGRGGMRGGRGRGGFRGGRGGGGLGGGGFRGRGGGGFRGRGRGGGFRGRGRGGY
ncbi:H/ACA ribonucleoprotein complex subunit 1-like [Oscarella lobularis]|uniref:H/ACA ribonucleoprotein complex subunit 1-like n=1 Tax=Oscarella lobularis TaxID=121494 RepID=UPI003313D1DF